MDPTGEPMVRRMARVLLEGGCAAVYLVTGADADAVAGACADLGPAVVPVYNRQFASGMGTSIAAGVSLAPADTPILVATCDMPAVRAAHVRALIDTSADGARRVASVYPAADDDTVRVTGVPALFPATDRQALCALTGDRGARDLLKQTDTLSVFLRNGSLDLDTPADVARWHASGG